MKLEGLLTRKRPAVIDRWRHLITTTYPKETARFLSNEKDRFANPVGHFIREGTSTVLDEILGGMDRKAIRTSMDPLVRIRAVQDFDASAAVDFVFLLKRAVREVAGDEIEAQGLWRELLEFESRVDDVARVAFAIYSGCREQLSEIKVREIRNRSAVLLRRMNMLGDEPALEDDVQGGEA